MYKHLLIPTDGSHLSELAIQKGVQLAQSMNAKITGVYVIPKFHILTYRVDMLENTREQFMSDSKAQAEKYLSVISEAAKSAGVPYETLYTVNDHPYEAIIQTAKD